MVAENALWGQWRPQESDFCGSVMWGKHCQEFHQLKMGDNSPHTLQNQCFRLFTNKNLGRILVYLIVWMNTGFAKRGILGSILKMWHTGILQDALSLLNIVVSAVPIDWCCTWDCQWHFKSFDCTGFQQLHECAQLDFKQTYLCFGSTCVID